MNLRWGKVEKTVIHRVGHLGSFVAAIGLFAYIIVWLLIMGAVIGLFALIGVFALLLMLVWLPCFLWCKASPKTKSQSRV